VNLHPDPTSISPYPLYNPLACRIVSVTKLTPDEKLFRIIRIDGTPLGHLPGQFLQLSLLGWGEAPISVASSPTRGELFELGVRRAGGLTGALHRLEPGDTVGIRGPFGRPFDLSFMAGQDLLLISGGCGLAPLRSLIQYCQDRPDDFGSVTILHGAKSPEHLMFRDELTSWESSQRFTCSVTVNHSSGEGCYDGAVGLVTELIAPLKLDPVRTVAVIVGPPDMYRTVIHQLKQKGLPSGRIMVSLERHMQCGVGKCGHCSIEQLSCCQDGPVFFLSEIEHLRGAL
jgi:sulfhydrogenase subunit gamma (sulfur reductase)